VATAVLSGYESAELSGLSVYDMYPAEERKSVEGYFKSDHESLSGSSILNTKWKRKDGTNIPMEISCTKVHLDGQLANLCVGRDISNRIPAGAPQMARACAAAKEQNVQSLGVLAGGIAHDFNNLLTSVLGNADLVKSLLPKKSDALPFVEEIIETADQMTLLTSQMLAYSGKGKFIIGPVNLSKTVEKVIGLMAIKKDTKIKLSSKLHDQLPSIEADTSQLQQVVVNLVTNGTEAYEEEIGTVSVRTDIVEVDDAYFEGSFYSQIPKSGTYALLEVQDSGCGIDEETLPCIFDPFFSTKFAGRGLGLSAVLGIVHSHHGAIRVISAVNRGSTFQVLLPIIDDTNDPTETTTIEPAKPVPVSNGTIKLKVDNYQNTVEQITKMLRR